MVSSSSSALDRSQRQVLRVMPNESAIFNGVMAVMCTSFTCLLLWMTLDNIYRPDSDPIFRLVMTFFSAFLASFFCYLALLALRNLVRKLGLRKFTLLSPKREGTKWPILNATVAATYAAITLCLLWVSINDSLCEAAMKSILGIKSPTVTNMLAAELSMFCSSGYFCYLAILAFGEIICQNLKHPKSDSESQCKSRNDSEVLLSDNEVPAAMV